MGYASSYCYSYSCKCSSTAIAPRLVLAGEGGVCHYRGDCRGEQLLQGSITVAPSPPPSWLVTGPRTPPGRPASSRTPLHTGLAAMDCLLVLREGGLASTNPLQLVTQVTPHLHQSMSHNTSSTLPSPRLLPWPSWPCGLVVESHQTYSRPLPPPSSTLRPSPWARGSHQLSQLFTVSCLQESPGSSG